MALEDPIAGSAVEVWAETIQRRHQYIHSHAVMVGEVGANPNTLALLTSSIEVEMFTRASLSK